jgi:hypothetical protein
VTAATATKPTRAMSDATRDAILSLFQCPGQVMLERDASGSWWAGCVGPAGRMGHHRGGTIAEAVARALSPGTPAQADGATP